MAKFNAKWFLVSSDDKEYVVEQDTPLRAIEQTLELFSVTKVVIEGKDVTVRELEEADALERLMATESESEPCEADQEEESNETEDE